MDLFIHGEIGWNVDAETVRAQLERAGDEVTVIIHSRGGSAHEGFAIHDLLKNSGKKIITRIEGVCGSIATVIFLAGSTRQITENSEWLVHYPWKGNQGDAESMEKAAQELRRVEAKLAAFYAANMGGEESMFMELMKEDKWRDAQEALLLGFATEIVKPVMASAYLSRRNPNEKLKAEDMSSIKEMFADKLDGLRALIEGGKQGDYSPKSYVLALENGVTIKSSAPADKNGPTAGDTFEIEGEGTLKDGAYVVASSREIITIEGNRIVEVLKPEMVEAMNFAREEIGKLYNLAETRINSLSTQVGDLMKKSQEQEANLKAAKEENEGLKAQIVDLKKHTASNQKLPGEHHVQSSAHAEGIGVSQTTKILNEIKNKKARK